jgi:endonuclease/exonuclease/phosphatase family metal-dependent hydrolase
MRFHFLAIIVCWFSTLCVLQATEPGTNESKSEKLPGTDSLRVMTFNIRYDNPRDGENVWPNRREKVASMIRLHGADIAGLQEALKNQIDELAKLLPAYDWIGVGRNDGKDAGEFTPIFFRRDRVELVEKNTFWLSETPQTAGSRSWDAALPRIVTWAKFRKRDGVSRSDALRRNGDLSRSAADAPQSGEKDRSHAERGNESDGDEFYVFNTHFDHLGAVARLESALLLRNKAAEIAGELPFVVIGDFNCTETSPPYAMLTSERVVFPPERKPPPMLAKPLVDARGISRHPHHGPLTTWNGFQALVPGRKIDHIFVRGRVDVLAHAVLADHWDGRFPSDHLPVLAEIVVKD